MPRIPLPPCPSREKPISPKEIATFKTNTFPQHVIRAVNMLLSQKFCGRSATFTQDEIIQAIIERSGNKIKREEIFEKGWLNFEDIYRNAGWRVEYDKPGYNETYAANFTFTVK